MQHDGTWSCLTNNGFWAECDLRGAQPLVEQPGQVVVAQVRAVRGACVSGCVRGAPGTLRCNPMWGTREGAACLLCLYYCALSK